MHKALVTGGAGFIGSHLVDRLVADGHSVRILDDFSTGKKANVQALAKRVEVCEGSITDKMALQRAVEGIDMIFHLAALPSVARSIDNPAATHDVCATGTMNVLDAARIAKVRRVIYAASSSAYGDTPGEVRDETDALAPLSPYAAAKLAGEFYCRSFTRVYGLETVRLRFFNIFGPRQDARSPYSGVIALFGAAFKEGRTPRIEGDGLQSRDFTYVDNVVQALVKASAATAASGNVYNIGAGGTVTLLQLVTHLNELLGTQIRPTHGPARPGDVRHSQANISKARIDLGYEPTVSFVAGLQRTLDSLGTPISRLA